MGRFRLLDREFGSHADMGQGVRYLWEKGRPLDFFGDILHIFAGMCFSSDYDSGILARLFPPVYELLRRHSQLIIFRAFQGVGGGGTYRLVLVKTNS